MKYRRRISRSGGGPPPLPTPSPAWSRGRGRSWRSAAGRPTRSSRIGIDEMLPDGVTLIHGPGCPVCVTPLGMIDKRHRDRPSAGRDLLLVWRHAAGARLATGPALGQGGGRRRAHRLFAARRGGTWRASIPSEQVVFFAVGFETTAPANAMAVLQAEREGLANFSVLVSHVLVPPAIEAMLGSPTMPRAGLPGGRPRLHGHGLRANTEPIARALSRADRGHRASSRSTSCRASTCASRQLEEGRAEVENQYAASVRREGNQAAQALHRARCSTSCRASGAASARSRRAACGCATPTRASTRSDASA